MQTLATDPKKVDLLNTADFADLKHATVVAVKQPSPKDSQARVIITNKMITNEDAANPVDSLPLASSLYESQKSRMSINDSHDQMPVVVEVYSGSKNTYETNKNRYVNAVNDTQDVNMDMTVMSLNKTAFMGGTLPTRTFQKKPEQNQDPYGSGSMTTDENEE